MKYNNTQLVSLFLLYIITFSKITEAYVLDKIIAIINKDIILESDIKKKQISNIKYNKNYFYKNNTISLKTEILEQLINDTLILQLAQRANLNLTDDQINNIINYITEKNNITTTELKAYLLNNNISYNDYMNYVKNDTIINTVYDHEMHQRIKISDYEIKTLTHKLILKHNHIAFQLDHIFIPIQDNATKNQIQQAEQLGNFLAKEMKHGINTEQLVTLYSSNNNKFSTIHTNKIHWSTIQELPKLFATSLIKEKIYINQIIGPIHSNAGFHILKINDIDNFITKDITTKVHIRHIFIKTSNINDDETIQKKLLKIKKYIENNSTTFSIEAKQISEDPNSSYKGGDLGWKYIEDCEKIFQIPIKSLKKGEISSPIKTEHGWYIIQLINSQQVDKNIIFYQKNAYQKIFNKKLNETMNHWIQELKISNYIQIPRNDN